VRYRHLTARHRSTGTLQRAAPRELLGRAQRRQDGIGTFPDLDDPTNGRETRIYLYDLDYPIPGLQPSRVLFNDEAGT
jgi:hypothetical protein